MDKETNRLSFPTARCANGTLCVHAASPRVERQLLETLMRSLPRHLISCPAN
ncbi:hypothetical protein [uncultured Nostoc sp.]|uniref:hypothetical protein n=1 Tax=uncultured Nostoc sp. TaxID=340711 RepID=UPI0035CB4245